MDIRFPVTRDAALDRLKDFVPLAGRAYAARRNHDGGPDGKATTSLLSPAIRRRLVSEAEVAAAALGAHGFAGAEKFAAEVCWRTYWVGWLAQRPAIWTRWQADVARMEAMAQDDGKWQRRYHQALAAQTGIDCFDAWVRELTETGWLHNHVRMSFASIWCFTLRLPWQLGAALFYRHLLDACPASNTLGWRWVVGLQTQGKTYLARADLIRDLSGGRFRVEAPLAREAAPWPADVIPPPSPPAPAQRADPGLRTGLFITSEDLSMETLALPVQPIALAATSTIGGSPAPLKQQLANAMLADGLARAAGHFGLAADRLDEAQPLDAMRGWAAAHGLKQIITADAPVGPVRDRLDALTPALAADGVALVRLRRQWDDAAWPHANKGFFPFKSVIPKLLQLPVGALA
ncbi:MAG: FAD-binding domain-containing protein [Sphingomonadales bacterium]|jgi:deoxyribodipyrimidine photo-lyase